MLEFSFERFGQIYIGDTKNKGDGLYADTSFKAGDALTFYAGVQRKKAKGSDRVPVFYEEYQIEVPGGCVLVPWDSLMERPGGFDSLDLCGHLANHTSKLALQNIDFHVVEASLLKDIPRAKNALKQLKQETEKQKCYWKYVVLMVASREIKAGEELQCDYHMRIPFNEYV